MAAATTSNPTNPTQLSSGDSAAILHFKNTLNSTIPKFTNQGENPVFTGNDLIIEPSMLTALDNAMAYTQEQIKIRAASVAANNPNLLSRIQSMETTGEITASFSDIIRELQASSGTDARLKDIVDNAGLIIDEFESLSPQTQAKISTAQKLFRPTVFDTKNAAEQGFQTIRNTQSYLGIEDENTTISGDRVAIADKTSRAIRNQMSALQAQNPDLGSFDPPVFDARAVAFLENLQAKQMRNAGVTKDNLNTTLLNLWSLEQLRKDNPAAASASESPEMKALGETSSLLAAMRYMTSGGLVNGTSAARPSVEKSWDLEWSNSNSGDHFLNGNVYKALTTYGQVDISELLQKSPYEFRNENLVEAVLRLKEKAKTPEGLQNQPLQDMVKQFEHFETMKMDSKLTQHQVGMIAIEIMSIQANKLCIDDKDINEAIEDGRFMPHLADLKLLDAGLGYPPGSLEKFSLEQWPASQRKHDVFAQAHLGIDLLAYRSKAFESRFGSISEDSAKKVLDTKYGHIPNVKIEFVEKNLQSPILRYNSGSMGGESVVEQQYAERRQSYLNSLGMRLQENGCKTPELTQDQNSGNNPNSSPIPNGNGGNTQGQPHSDSDCLADQVGQGPCNDRSNTLGSDCLADTVGQGDCSRQFGGAVGSGGVDTNTAITETIESVTGSGTQEPVMDVCPPADMLQQGACNVATSNTRP